MHTTNAAATKLLTTRTGRSSAGTRNPNGAYGGSAGCTLGPFGCRIRAGDHSRGVRCCAIARCDACCGG